jgi:serine/threonine-protein kinase
LRDANLDDANLLGANLYEADVTREQLAQAKSIKGAIMPQGGRHA